MIRICPQHPYNPLQTKKASNLPELEQAQAAMPKAQSFLSRIMVGQLYTVRSKNGVVCHRLTFNLATDNLRTEQVAMDAANTPAG